MPELNKELLRLGYKIKYERLNRGMSQLDLALDTELTTRTISRIECGIIDPKYLTLKKIADAFQIDLAQLLDMRL